MMECPTFQIIRCELLKVDISVRQLQACRCSTPEDAKSQEKAPKTPAQSPRLVKL